MAQFDVTLSVNDYAQDRFLKFISKMSKIAFKLGLTPIEAQHLYDIIIISKKHKDGVVYIEKVKKVYQVIGETPVLDGWELVARLNYDRRFGNQAMVSEAPGQTIPEEFLGTINPHRCDHCHVQRFRTKAYIVKKDHEVKQIGGTCLGDFIRSNTQEMIEFFAKFWDFVSVNVGDEEDYNPSRQWFWGMEFAYASLRFIKEYGFVSAKSEQSSSMSVVSLLSTPKSVLDKDEKLKEYIASLTARPTDEEKQQIQDIFNKGKALESTNSFFHNVKLLCGTEYWKSSEINTLVAWIGSCLKVPTEKKVEVESVWLGVEGEKVSGMFTCNRLTGYDGPFGISWFHMGHIEGNSVNFYSSKKLVIDGETKHIKGTIKALNEFRSTKQTQLTRVKVI